MILQYMNLLSLQENQEFEVKKQLMNMGFREWVNFEVVK